MMGILDQVAVPHLFASDVVGDHKTTVLSQFVGFCFVGKECDGL